MDTLRITRLHTRYRLPASAPDAAPRLERVLRAVLEEGVEHALARSGVPVHEEICIREAYAPVRLNSASPDPTLIGAWSVGLAESIQRVIRDGGHDVVRYRTRNHALVDLVDGVARGDFRRAWAWRTLGLWSTDDHPTPADAGREAVRALTAHPESVVAALAGAARAGVLPRLAAALPPSDWLELTRVALGCSTISPDAADGLLGEGAGGSPHVVAGGGLAAPRPGPAARHEAPAPDHQTPAAARALRIVRRSEIARALGSAPLAGHGVAWMLAVLAVLEVDPSALQADGAWASALVGSVLREAVGGDVGGNGSAPAGRDASGGRPTAPEDRGAREPRRAGAPHPTATARVHPNERADDGERSPGHEPPAGSTPGAEPAAPEGAPTRPDEAPDARAGASRAEEDDASPTPSVADAATTEWGGLLFLLHVVDELGLPAEILAADVFRARSLPWVLRGVAWCLLNVDEGDPAVAAFAGVVPGRTPPWEGDGPASPAEELALEDLSRRVAVRVHERLAGAPPTDGPAAAATVRACARRRAELRCDTGWFDVLLRLDEVAVETRRAGLDLDPGWIPWLGAVVRFIYV